MGLDDHAWPEEFNFPDLTDISVIARGAHATVYRAHQTSAGRLVALKVDNRILGPDDDRQRFEREVRAVGQLSEHPAIINTFIAGFTNAGRPYVVTELCRGSYADRIAEHGPLQPDEVKHVGIQIADALATAHAQRILHRDIKPANILIDNRGNPVLADFGVASLMESRTEEPVVRAAMTPAYAPLETFHLRPSGEPGDVYSLAATLYALLKGNPPRFPADDREFTIEDVMSLFGEPIADIPGVSQVMMGMLRAAMTNNPGGRPQALQFRDMLESVPMAASTGAIPVVRTQPEEPVAPPPHPAPPPQSPARALPPQQPPEPPAHVTPPERSAQSPAHASPPEWPTPAAGRPLPAPDSAHRPSPPPGPESGWADGGEPQPRRRPSPSPHPTGASQREPWGGPAPDRQVIEGDSPRQSDSGPARLPVLAKGRELATRRERRIEQRGGKERGSVGPLVLVGGIAIAIVIAFTAGLFLFVTDDDDNSKADKQDSADTSSCSLNEYGVACMDKPRCFEGELVDDDDKASAKEVSCKKEHRWEAYAKGDLPQDVDSPTYANVEAVSAVKKACFSQSDSPPLEQLVGMSASDWKTNVLPPSQAEFDKGTREFHCVAKRKDGEKTTGSSLVGS